MKFKILVMVLSLFVRICDWIVKSSELRDFIVEAMLKSKELPEYIRYNLMDQFKN